MPAGTHRPRQLLYSRPAHGVRLGPQVLRDVEEAADAYWGADVPSPWEVHVQATTRIMPIFYSQHQQLLFVYLVYLPAASARKEGLQLTHIHHHHQTMTVQARRLCHLHAFTRVQPGMRELLSQERPSGQDWVEEKQW